MASTESTKPTADSFRRAWSKFATGVSIITTRQGDGEVHGMAANGITSVSLDPLLVLVCVQHKRNTYPLVRETGRFAISFLSEAQLPISEYYAGPPEDRKGQVDVHFNFTERGSATVDGCLAYMDCHVVDEHESGDHSIFIGEVDEIEVSSGKPLVFFGSAYHKLAGE